VRAIMEKMRGTTASGRWTEHLIWLEPYLAKDIMIEEKLG
jgi:hypothetical protein